MHDTRFHDFSCPMGVDRRILARCAAHDSPKPGRRAAASASSLPAAASGGGGDSSSSTFASAAASSTAANSRSNPTTRGAGSSTSSCETRRSSFRPSVDFLRKARTTSLRADDPEATGSAARRAACSDGASSDAGAVEEAAVEEGAVDGAASLLAASRGGVRLSRLSAPSNAGRDFGGGVSGRTARAPWLEARRSAPGGGALVRLPLRGVRSKSSTETTSASAAYAASTIDGTEETRRAARTLNKSSTARSRMAFSLTSTPGAGDEGVSESIGATRVCIAASRMLSPMAASAASSSEHCGEPSRDAIVSAPSSEESSDQSAASSTVSKSINVGARALVLKTWPSAAGMRATRPSAWPRR
mmetsp:Transcript_10735/g.35693  ORF Transcript_10735/g.35693 Transcript_10735/m.35693 type:complete len:359 (-) Transcript_10735:350-1426(-)